MGLGDFLSSILGTQNNFQATAPVNGFQAQGGGYGQAAQGAIGQAQGNLGQQQDFINMLTGQANGTAGPSVAQQLLQQQTGKNNQSAASLVASQRGLNPALAAKLAMDNQAQNNQQAAQSGALLRSQEQLQSQGLLGQALGQQGAQNLSLLGQTGNLDLGVQGLNSQVAAQNANLNLGAQQINAGVAGQNASTAGSIVGGLLGGVGAVGTFQVPGGGGAGSSANTSGAWSSINAAGGLPTDAAMGIYSGGEVPGKASVPGNSPANDKVPAMVSPGEIVVPRSEASDPERAAAFVRAVINHNKGHSGGFSDGGMVADDQPISFGDAMSAGAKPLEDAAAGFIDRNYGTSLSAPAPVAPNTPADASPLQANVTPAPTVSATPQPAQQPPVSSVAPTASGVPRDFAQAQKAEQDAVAQGAKVTEQKDAAESTIADAQAAATQELQRQSAEQAATRQQGADKLFSDYASSKIDPNHYWSSLSTGGKITSAIGLILGGIGAGLSHGPNMALGVIDKAIDRDMDAQKVEMGKKENALKFYMAQTGNMQQAMALSKADARDVAAAQMTSASLKYASPAVAAQAAQTIAAMRKQSVSDRLVVQQQQNAAKIGDLQLQGAGYQQQIYRQMALSGNGATVGAEGEMSPEERMMHLSFAAKGPEGIQQKAAHTVMVPEQMQVGADQKTGDPVMQTRMVPRTALTPGKAEQAQKDLQSVGMMQNKVDVLDNLARKYPHGNAVGVLNPGDETAAKAAVAAIKEQFDRGFNLVNAQPSKETTELTDQIVKNPLDFFQNSARARASIDFLKNEIQGTKKLILQGSVFPRRGD